MLGNAGHRRLQAWAALWAVLVWVGSLALAQQGSLAPLEAPWNDLWFRVAGQTAPVDHVAVVELDEATLAAHADDPLVFWTPHFARAIETLRAVGVRVIGLDYLFSISPEPWMARMTGRDSPAARAYDRSFREVVASGQVILAGSQTQAEPLLPAPEYLAVLPDFDIVGGVGATDLVFDADGTLRQTAPMAPGTRLAQGEQTQLISFPLLLAVRASGQSAASGAWAFGGRQFTPATPPWSIAWSGPPGSVPRLSMQRLLVPGAANDPEVQALAGKVVVLGVSFGAANDLHLTPYGHGLFAARQMGGPEVHAQIVEALLSGRFMAPVPALAQAVVLLALLALSCALFLRLPAGQGAIVLAVVLLALTFAAYGLHRSGWSLALAQHQLALILLTAGIYGLRFRFGENERQRTREMFARYVSGDVVQALLDADADAMPRLGGQALEVTVLFSDLRNFTTLSERLSPEEVVEMLNRWFAEACAVLRAEGGCIDKFIGDAIMVEFGAPLPQPDHARRAVRAALRLAEVAQELEAWMTQRFAGRELPRFAIGVGLHSGMAVVGNIGAPERMEYTAIGDTVNLASRLEGVTKELGCVVAASRATVLLAGDGVRIGQSRTLTVKGREAPVEVLEILGLEN